jgi:hypothetical protein
VKQNDLNTWIFQSIDAHSLSSGLYGAALAHFHWAFDGFLSLFLDFS